MTACRSTTGSSSASVRRRTRAGSSISHSVRSRVDVVAGEIVTFYEEADAQHFVEQGLAERVSKSEAKALLAESATHAKATNVHNITTPAQAGKRAAR